MPINLLPLTSADIPSAARICGASMQNDKHTALKSAHPTKPYDHASGMEPAFEYWISLPSSEVECVKAVDESGGILGVVVWYKRLDGDTETAESAQNADRGDGDTSKTQVTPEAPDILVSSDYTPTQSTDALEELNDVTSAHLAAYQQEMKRYAKSLIVGTLAVDPAAQSQGVGSLLIKHGTDIADAEGAVCWVHSSDGAEGVYAKAGFEVDDVLRVDLDDWAKRAGIGGEWGEYVFRYMVRLPKT